MKKIYLLVFSAILSFGQLTVNAQLNIPTDEEIANGTDEQKIEAAEYLYNQHLYYHSLRVWKSILKDYPDNVKINYMAGFCQLKVGAEKTKALAYFEKTRGKIASTNNEKKVKESQAPLDAYFYLGQAYHLNGKYNEALKAFNDYKTVGAKELTQAQINEADKHIGWANNAITMVANPNKGMKITNLGPEINSSEEEYSPVLSLDENVIYFTSRRLREDGSNKDVLMLETGSMYEDVYVSFRDGDGKAWSKPKLMNFGSELDENEATVSVSADGTEVYIYVDKEGGGDLYRSSFLEGGFNAELEHMEGDINSSSWETHCTITPDGNTLFFTSNRSGGMGGLDIYRVRKLPNGEWSKAEMLPAPINTIYDEDAPFIHPSGNILYYSSNGPKSMGGCDVFYSRITDKENLTFEEPVNMGYPLNTPDDDVFFVVDAKGEHGYYSSSQNGGYGNHDIFMIEFENPFEEPFAILKGFVLMTDGSQIPDNININLDNITDDNEHLKFKPRRVDGGFVMSLKPCHDYTIEYFMGDKSLKKDKFTVPCESKYQEIYKELIIDTLFLAFDTNAVANNNTTNNTTNSNITNNTNQNNTSSQNNTNLFEAKDAMYYDKYFDYNVLDVALAEKKFADFIGSVKQMASKGNVVIAIESSASKVPTTTFKTNFNLSKSRAEEAKNEILSALKSDGVDVSKITFVKPRTKVQGPEYRNDYEKNREQYGKYQYVKVWAK